MAQLQFSTIEFDNRQLKNMNYRQRKLKSLFNQFFTQVAVIGAATGFNDPDKEFYLKDYPAAQKDLTKLLKELCKQITSGIIAGNQQAFDISKSKYGTMITTLAGKNGWSKDFVEKISVRNAQALEAFQTRKVGGMGLSERVWKTQEGTMEQIEMALECGLAQGKSAAALSRDVREYLNEPAKLFRRVRDKDGILRLSKAAKAYHTGRGVYRSSYKNALRLTATENNMAYRTADCTTRKKLSFVLGFEVHTSNNHPVTDICDELKGKYPNEFKFVGWHPFCRCFTTDILPSEEEFEKWRTLPDGEREKYEFKDKIKQPPKGFKDWCDNNAERVMNAKNTPYFIKDNFKDGIIGNDYVWVKDEPKRLTPSEIGEKRHAARPKGYAEKVMAMRQKTQAVDKLLAEAKDFSFNKNVDDWSHVLHDVRFKKGSTLAQIEEREKIVKQFIAKAKDITNKNQINVLAVAKDFAYDKNISAKFKELIKVAPEDYAKKHAITKELAKAVSVEKKDIASLSTYIPDPKKWRKQFSSAELHAVCNSTDTAINKWLNKYGYNSWDEAPLAHKKAKLDSEILHLTTTKKYNTWEVARDIYEKKLAIVEHEIKVDAVKQSMKAVKAFKSSSPILKDYIAKYEAAAAKNDLTEMEAWSQKAENKVKDLKAAQAKAAAKKAAKNGTNGGIPTLNVGNTAKQSDHIGYGYTEQEKIELIKKHTGVTEAVAQDLNAAVYGFTYQWDYEIRQVQCGNLGVVSRHGHTLAEIQKKAIDCEEFIEKSPKWDGAVTYRGMALSKDDFDNLIDSLKKGEGNMLGSASWSTTSNVSQGFADMNAGLYNGVLRDHKVVLYTNKHKKATSIKHLSHYATEDEVLSSKDCRWRYVSETQKGSYIFIEVEPSN